MVLQNIKDKILEMFGNNINKDKVNFYVNMIVLEFADDFPEMKSKYIKNLYNDKLVKIDFEEIDKNFIRPLGYISGYKNISDILYKYPVLDEMNNINEIITLDLYSKIGLFSIVPNNIIQPLIDSTELFDETNQIYSKKNYVIIPSSHLPALLFYFSKRNVIPILRQGYNIDDQLFPILESFIIYKIIDYIFLEDLEQITNKLLDMVNKNDALLSLLDITNDETNVDLAISNINLGGVSISYDNNYKTKAVAEAVDVIDKMGKTIKGLLDNYKDYYNRIRNEKYNKYMKYKKMYSMGMFYFV